MSLPDFWLPSTVSLLLSGKIGRFVFAQKIAPSQSKILGPHDTTSFQHQLVPFQGNNKGTFFDGSLSRGFNGCRQTVCRYFYLQNLENPPDRILNTSCFGKRRPFLSTSRGVFLVSKRVCFGGEGNPVTPLH